MTIQQLQQRNLDTSGFLSQLYLMEKTISPHEVIAVLNQHRISFVLVGLHGYVGWMREARATMDVDVIVALRQVKKAVQVLLQAFPDLEAVDLEMVTRLKRRDSDDVAIDVMKPLQQPHRQIFKNTVTVEDKGQRYRIPTLEMALILKFCPMISPSRSEEDKLKTRTISSCWSRRTRTLTWKSCGPWGTWFILKAALKSWRWFAECGRAKN